MSEQTQTEEQGVNEDEGEEEENTQNNQLQGHDTENNPAEDDSELERQRDEPQEDPATVKVVLVPEGHVMTVAFAIGLSIQELKCHLASELRVPAEVLQISLDGRMVEEQQSLMELGVQPHGSTRIEMSSVDPNTHPLRPVRPPEQDNMPDVITVQVQPDDGVLREVVVEIQRPLQQKPFLGGYRHRVTSTEYHHASTQTLPRKRPDRGVVIFNRETQTVKTLEKAQDTPCSVSTQMTGIGCYISCMNDKLVAPGRYLTAAEYHARRLKAVIYLQTCTRRWLAQQKVERIKRERDRRLAWLEMQERRRIEEKEEQMRDRRQRFWNPQTREDFNLMYQALEKWRCEEEEQINATLKGAEKKAALCFLLEKEITFISAIGLHRIAVHNNNIDQSVRHILDKAAAPHRWRGKDGRMIEMDTKRTFRARELRDLYNSVSLSPVKKEERLQVLMTLKDTVTEHDCLLTRDLVELIDREVDLMTRGVKEANLGGLRRRINTLFLQYIKTPAFNPEIAKLLKVPQNPSDLRTDMFLCRSCGRHLGSASFNQSASAGFSNRCRDCARLDNISRLRSDFSCYKSILHRLRDYEQQLDADAKVPILLQVEDMQYLVKVIWASRSALSADRDLYNLVFVRWESQKNWSPWNCILLSKEETSAHLELEDVSEAYGKSFVQSIKHKHLVALRHFSQIPELAQYLDSKLTTTLGNQLVTKPITTATDKHVTKTIQDTTH